MTGKFKNKVSRGPKLDKLSGQYESGLSEDLVKYLAELSIESFKEEIESVFQLIEGKLRLTDAIYLKNALEDFKELHYNKWSLIYHYSDAVEKGEVTSAASHQLIALIQLIEEDSNPS